MNSSAHLDHPLLPACVKKNIRGQFIWVEEIQVDNGDIPFCVVFCQENFDVWMADIINI